MMKFLPLILILCLASTGCSVGMAMSGKKEPQLGAIRVGATRGEVEMHLGPPLEIREENGNRIDLYEYEIGNEPSAGRAIGHGVMDVLTFGLWEVIGTPVEAIQGEKKRLLISYDDKNIVTNVGAIAVPKKTRPSETEAEAQM